MTDPTPTHAAPDAKPFCDIMVHAKYIIPVSPAGVVWEDHSLAIKDDKIVAVLPKQEAYLWSTKITLDRTDCLLAPGLVNAHTHNPMTLFRGLADDLPLLTWLEKHIWPAEKALMSHEFCQDGAALAIAEMVRGGTTCCNESYFFPDALATTYQKYGFRAMVGLPMIGFPTAWASSQQAYLDRGETVACEFAASPLLGFAWAPHAPYTVNDEALTAIAERASAGNMPLHIHLHETQKEVDDAVKQDYERPIARLHRLGLVNERLIAVHMTALNPEEIKLFAEQKAHVVHCPESNLKLASGFCPVHELHTAGVNVALGTDGCASNNDLDMIGEMRTAALIGKAVAQNAAAVSAPQALHMATLGGAQALGWADDIGSIEVGKQADFFTVELSEPEAMPMYDPISWLVYASSRHQVRDTFIAGQAKMLNRQLMNMDVEHIKQSAQQWAERAKPLGDRSTW